MFKFTVNLSVNYQAEKGANQHDDEEVPTGEFDAS